MRLQPNDYCARTFVYQGVERTETNATFEASLTLTLSPDNSVSGYVTYKRAGEEHVSDIISGTWVDNAVKYSLIYLDQYFYFEGFIEGNIHGGKFWVGEADNKGNYQDIAPHMKGYYRHVVVCSQDHPEILPLPTLGSKSVKFTQILQRMALLAHGNVVTPGKYVFHGEELTETEFQYFATITLNLLDYGNLTGTVRYDSDEADNVLCAVSGAWQPDGKFSYTLDYSGLYKFDGVLNGDVIEGRFWKIEPDVFTYEDSALNTRGVFRHTLLQ